MLLVSSPFPAPPTGTVHVLTLYWSVEQPSRVYAHRSNGAQGLNVREDLGPTDHTQLKVIQLHQYPAHQALEAEMYDDHDVLRQGGGDGGEPPRDDVFTPGPTIESISDDSVDGGDAPAPDDGADFDMDDGTFWTRWMGETRSDMELQKQRQSAGLAGRGGSATSASDPIACENGTTVAVTA